MTSQKDGASVPLLHGVTHEPGGTDDIYMHYGQVNPARNENYARTHAVSSAATVNGTAYFMLFTALFSVSISTMVLIGASTAASGLTLARFGLYTVDASENLTAVIGSADVHAAGANILGGAANQPVFGTQNVVWSVPLTVAGDFTTPLASYAMVRGTRYCAGMILYSSGSPTMPTVTLMGSAPAFGLGFIRTRLTPTISAAKTGLTDLPTSQLASGFGSNGLNFWVGLQ